jgi:hypothetical protein
MSKNKITASIFGINIDIDVDEVGKNLKQRKLDKQNHEAIQTYNTDKFAIVDQNFKEDEEYERRKYK